MANWQQIWQELCAFVRETVLLQSTKELLEWDERTTMPELGGEYRAEQLTLLSSLIHRRRTDPRLGAWLAELADSPLAADRNSDSGATIRQLRRDYDRQTRVPPQLVEELTRAASLGQQAWIKARSQHDFRLFQPHLQRLVELKRQEAEALGYDDSPYDALLDEFEPGARTRDLATVLAELAQQLVPLIHAVQQSQRRAPTGLLRRSYPIDQQRLFGYQAASQIGFDFDRGRLDVTHHPFCSSMGPHDCRITTRYDEQYFPSAFFGILHEAGHAIYEQGLRTELHGLPPGTYASLGIHESQSRLWENFVGRRRSFWQHFLPLAQQAFPGSLSDTSLDGFYAAINDVRPSLIRVEADEATYNLHIVIRFEIEQSLIRNHVQVGDLPGLWNDKYRQCLGIEPPHDGDGVLQDIHWSAGLFGYFPTYALGNLYAAQFFEQAAAELGDLDAQFAGGEFAPLRQWLQDRIHRHGQCYTATELVQRVTGRPLTHEPLMRHLRSKLGPLYGFA